MLVGGGRRHCRAAQRANHQFGPGTQLLLWLLLLLLLLLLLSEREIRRMLW